MLSRAHGLRCSPNCAHVTTSQYSSNVPMPPGSATNASASSAICALRWCIVPTTRSSVRPGCASSFRISTSGITPITSPPPARNRVRNHAHQAYLRPAIHQSQTPPRDLRSQHPAPRPHTPPASPCSTRKTRKFASLSLLARLFPAHLVVRASSTRAACLTGEVPLLMLSIHAAFKRFAFDRAKIPRNYHSKVVLL